MKINFDTDNAVFDECCYEEIKRILDRIAEDIRCGHIYGSIIDINGNIIGSWCL